MCRFCCSATGPVYGMTCNDRVGHDGPHTCQMRDVDEDGELTEQKIVLEWDRNLASEAAWN